MECNLPCSPYVTCLFFYIVMEVTCPAYICNVSFLLHCGEMLSYFYRKLFNSVTIPLGSPFTSHIPHFRFRVCHFFRPIFLSTTTSPITAVNRTVASPSVSNPLRLSITAATRLGAPVLSNPDTI